MKADEIFKLRAEADAHHLQAKLDEAKIEAIQDIEAHKNKILKLEQEIEQLKREINGAKEKAALLKQKHEKLQSADEVTFESAKNEFIGAIESLQDKNIFISKTTEWFNNIKGVTSELKKDVKERVAHW